MVRTSYFFKMPNTWNTPKLCWINLQKQKLGIHPVSSPQNASLRWVKAVSLNEAEWGHVSPRIKLTLSDASEAKRLVGVESAACGGPCSSEQRGCGVSWPAWGWSPGGFSDDGSRGCFVAGVEDLHSRDPHHTPGPAPPGETHAQSLHDSDS